MSKILARERQFDAQRRAQLSPSPGAQTPNEPSASEASSAVAVEAPAPEALQSEAAGAAAVRPVDPALELAPNNAGAKRVSRRRFYLLFIALLLTCAAYLQPKAQTLNWLRLTAGMEAGKAAQAPAEPLAPPKQTRSARLLPPTLRFAAVGAIHEPKNAEEIPPYTLPSSLWPMSVSSPMNLVPNQPFVRWENTLAAQPPVQSHPQEQPLSQPAAENTTAQPRPDDGASAAVTPSSPVTPVNSTLRTLKLMDAAIANAERASEPETKKPGD